MKGKSLLRAGGASCAAFVLTMGSLLGLGCGDDDAGSSIAAAYDASRPPSSSHRDASASSDAGRPSSPPAPPPPGSPPPPAEPTSPPHENPEDVCAMRESREPVVLYLSADDSNSMASPAIARSNIRGGIRPSRHYLRVYEFLNYYNVHYSAPPAGQIEVVPELREGDEPGEWTLQVGLQAAMPEETPRARVITFVLDTSGSMDGAPMQRQREVVRAILHGLREGDRVSMVEWNTERTVRLEGHTVAGPDDPNATRVADLLRAGGGTDLNAGLRYGYELARRFHDPERLNRLVLISDGIANAGITDLDLIAENADDGEAGGIYLVGVGVGQGVNDTLMNAVTDAGRGAYVYVDTPEEARRIFVDRFSEVMEVALRDVRLELTLPWHMAIREASAEEVSGNPAEVREQHLAPGDSMVFHQTLASCDLAEASGADVIRARGTFVREDNLERFGVVVESTMDDLLARPDQGFARGNAIVAYARALIEADELFDRGQPTASAGAIEEALATVRAANPDGSDPDLSEIADLLDTYRNSWLR